MSWSCKQTSIGLEGYTPYYSHAVTWPAPHLLRNVYEAKPSPAPFQTVLPYRSSMVRCCSPSYFAKDSSPRRTCSGGNPYLEDFGGWQRSNITGDLSPSNGLALLPDIAQGYIYIFPYLGYFSRSPPGDGLVVQIKPQLYTGILHEWLDAALLYDVGISFWHCQIIYRNNPGIRARYQHPHIYLFIDFPLIRSSPGIKLFLDYSRS